MDRSKRDFSFFSLRGSHGERIPTAEEVFKRNREKIIAVQKSIERKSLKGKK